jgi:hypothetical protein
MSFPDSEQSNHCKFPHDCPHIEQAVDISVKRTFAILGVDIDKPESVEEFRADLRFSKQLNKFVGHGQMAAVAAIFVALMAAMWAGIVDKVKGH